MTTSRTGSIAIAAIAASLCGTFGCANCGDDSSSAAPPPAPAVAPALDPAAASGGGINPAADRERMRQFRIRGVDAAALED